MFNLTYFLSEHIKNIMFCAFYSKKSCHFNTTPHPLFSFPDELLELHNGTLIHLFFFNVIEKS